MGERGHDLQSDALSYIQNFNRVDSLQCVDFGCDVLPPNTRLAFSGEGYPCAVLLVALVDAPNLSFSLRVRDIGRQTEGYGTEGRSCATRISP